MGYPSNFLLKDKVALITGCNRGIGRSIALHFVLHGAVVYANARNEGSLSDLLNDIPEHLRLNFIPVYFDITNTDAAKQVFVQINREQRRLDILVNNAAIMKDAIIGMIGKQLMEDSFKVNVFAQIEMLQFAVKLMLRNNSGSIINLASLVGTNGNSGQIVYSATKGAVVSITKTAAKELAAKNIRVNAISPGVIDTGLLSDVNSDILENIKSQIAMGRMGTPNEVADVAVFLASDMARYITGQIIGVDGAALM